MVKRIFLLILLALCLFSCFFDTTLHELTMHRTPYAGNELRIDGYYYSTSTSTSTDRISVAVFYRNGFCIHTCIPPKIQDTLNYIENEILLNDQLISKLKNSPSHIGVFQIINPDIEFEAWEYRNETVSHYGKIVNDTTFIINKDISHRTNEIRTENLTYRFKQFSPKPDSTNVYIK